MAQKPKEMQVMQQGGETFLPFSTWNDAVVSGVTAVSYNVAAARTAMGLPAGQPLFLIFSGDGPFWANFTNTAVIPAAGIADGTSSEFNPTARYIDGTVTSISFISAATAHISIQVFRP